MDQNTTQYLKIHQNVSFICAKKFTNFLRENLKFEEVSNYSYLKMNLKMRLLE